MAQGVRGPSGRRQSSAKAAAAPRRRRATSPRLPPAASNAFPVVGIGASAGGLEAFRKLLEQLPTDIGIAFVLIPHLDPTHPSMLVDLLRGSTSMPVVEAADGMPLERDHVYVIPPQAYLSVRRDTLRVIAPRAPHGARLPVDFFLHSLAEEYGQRGVCLIMSGTGADGSIGLKAVSEKGGLVIVQDPEEAAFDGMPRNAIGTGAVNLVLPIAQMPQALMRYARHPYVTASRRSVSTGAEEEEAIGEIIELLRARTSRDFTHYRRATLLRRAHRRMAAAGIEQIADYISMLREDSHEVELLAKDFLIHVTSFFRDAAAFEGLAKSVIPGLVQRVQDSAIRVWAPGCSTGEEAYSLAMLFLEEFAEQKRAPRLQIFASDIGADALDFARNGTYPESINADVSAERLQRFFTRQDHGYRVSRELRDLIVFTDHDLLADPPFSRIDLVSCRNVLIYLQPEEQRKVLSLLHFSLNENGYLFLGASETVGQLSEFFDPVSAPLRIFRRVGHVRRRERAFTPEIGERARALWPRLGGRPEQKVPSLVEAAQRALLDTYAPATALVDRNYRAFYYWGPTDRYMRAPPPGEPSRDALATLRDGLASRFRAAVRQASRNHETVTIGGARIQRNGDIVSVSISARPLAHEGEELLLVSFADEPARKIPEAQETPAEVTRAAQLERELEETRKELESTIRELEDSNQELSAINEEALSINEEFQSTNEELETSKEELQSLNEELITTNNQLHEALERQRQTSDDLQNILNSSDAATLFLDENLKIRFFTPGIATRFNLIASDVGRPLADLASPFADVDLIADARAVLEKLETVRREARTNSGEWFIYRTSPYRTQDNRIEGIVISLSEISAIKAIELAAEEARAYAQGIIDTVGEPLIVLDEELKIISAGHAFYQMFNASPADTVGRLLWDSDARHLDVPALSEFLDRARRDGEAPGSCEIEIELPQHGRRTLSVTNRPIWRGDAAAKRILVSLSDITDYRQHERQLAAAQQTADDARVAANEARHAAEAANLGKSRFLATVSHDLRQPLQTLTFLHDLLRSRITDAEAAKLVARADETLSSMAGMLGVLLDINQLEAGTIQPSTADFPVNDLLARLAIEFGDHAAARGLEWRFVRCGLAVHSDPRLLEQMLRNLLSNAIRYTRKGKVLLGCRRHGDRLSIEVWDTGVGISGEDLSRIFEEYRRGADRREAEGLGLGLAIVDRLGQLLGHAVTVRSQLGMGSVFAISVPIGRDVPPERKPAPVIEGKSLGGSILVIDDDPGVREALQLLLIEHGHHTASAENGSAALSLVRRGEFRPDVVISDYLLPGDMDGARTAEALRVALGSQVPVIFLTGDIGSARLRDLDLPNSTRFAKPVEPQELLQAVQRFGAASPVPVPAQDAHAAAAEANADAVATVFIVDDDRAIRETLHDLLAKAGYRVEAFANGEAFLDHNPAGGNSCFIVDIRLPGINGLELLARLAAAGNTSPAILITGHGDIATAVQAIKAGAFDFLEKPVRPRELLAVVERALRQAAAPAERASWHAAAALRIAALTARERQVMDHVINGHANKEIAALLGISQRTVETHRATLMKKLGAASVSDLVRLGLAAQAV